MKEKGKKVRRWFHPKEKVMIEENFIVKERCEKDKHGNLKFLTVKYKRDARSEKELLKVKPELKNLLKRPKMSYREWLKYRYDDPYNPILNLHDYSDYEKRFDDDDAIDNR